MNNDDLKKKISQIISEYCCPYGKTHKQLYGDDRMCYSKMNFAECNPITECTDALIAAGIGDVKDLQTQVNALEYSNLFLQAGYDSIEKDRQYWIGKYKAEEKRADIAEQALLTACAKMVKDEKDDINIELLVGVIYKKYLEQAEKELAEDRKDENN